MTRAAAADPDEAAVAPSAPVVCPNGSHREVERCVADEVTCPLGSLRITLPTGTRCAARPRNCSRNPDTCSDPPPRFKSPLLAGGIMLLTTGVVGASLTVPFISLFAAPYLVPLVAGIPMTIIGSRQLADDGSSLRDPGLMLGGVILTGLSVVSTPVLAAYLYTTLVWHPDENRVIGLATGLAAATAAGIASIPMWVIGGTRIKRPRSSASTPPEPMPTLTVQGLGLGVEWGFQ
ncbi:MAG: hypothetical protein U0271_24055 [Polyangiaceae bacterium]